MLEACVLMFSLLGAALVVTAMVVGLLERR
jgi:hypothetical protein